VLESDPAAADVQLATQTLTVTLRDERQISVPLSWYSRLLAATEEERNHWELLGEGYAIMWPDLDEHIGVEGLLAGRRSAEKPDALERAFGLLQMQQKC
jgi:hypothetical protein